MPDIYSAVWVSHSSLSDYGKCPRSYFLKNRYKSPKTGRKMQIISPALSLGQAVHSVLERLSSLPVKDRFSVSLLKTFDVEWSTFSGEKGGFSSKKQQDIFYDRGVAMLKQVTEHPGPLSRLAIKIQTDLPRYWLSPEDEIILSGKIDWLEYLPETDSVNIIDFKTGTGKEDSHSLQLPIYALLVHNIQKRAVSGIQYWYLEQSSTPEDKELPDLAEAHQAVLTQAKKVALARKLNHFACPNGSEGCRYCKPFEAILAGKGTMVGHTDRQDIFFLHPDQNGEMEFEAELL